MFGTIFDRLIFVAITIFMCFVTRIAREAFFGTLALKSDITTE